MPTIFWGDGDIPRFFETTIPGSRKNSWISITYQVWYDQRRNEGSPATNGSSVALLDNMFFFRTWEWGAYQKPNEKATKNG